MTEDAISDFTNLAEDICDTDFYRHCTGDALAFIEAGSSDILCCIDGRMAHVTNL